MTPEILLTIIAALTGIAFFGRFFFGSARSPLVVFSVTWIIVFATYALNLLPFHPLNSQTFLCTVLMITGFVTGTLFSLARRDRPIPSVPPVPEDLYLRYSKLMWIFVVLGWIGVGLFISTNQVKLQLLDAYERLDPTYEGVHPIIREFIHKICVPSLATACLVSSSLRARLLKWREESGSLRGGGCDVQRRLLVVAVIAAAGLMTFDLVSLKRMQTITVAVSLLTTYRLVTAQRRTRLRRKVIVATAVMLIIVSISYVTAAREIYIGGNIFTSWLLYFTGPLAFFDAFVGTGQVTDLYYGATSFMGIKGFLFGPLQQLPYIGRIVPGIQDYYFDRQRPMNIGEGLDYNAFGTVMLDGYYDFREAGVFLLALLCGFLSTVAYRRAQVSSSPIAVSLAAVTMVWVLLLPIGWPGGMQFVFGQIPLSILGIECILWVQRVHSLRRGGRL